MFPIIFDAEPVWRATLQRTISIYCTLLFVSAPIPVPFKSKPITPSNQHFCTINKKLIFQHFQTQHFSKSLAQSTLITRPWKWRHLSKCISKALFNLVSSQGRRIRVFYHSTTSLACSSKPRQEADDIRVYAPNKASEFTMNPALSAYTHIQYMHSSPIWLYQTRSLSEFIL